MIFIQRHLTYATNLIFSSWFALCVFLFSDAFCDVENGIKYYTSVIGSFVSLMSVSLFVKDVRNFVERNLTPITLRMLFVVGSLEAIHGIAQFFFWVPSHHNMFRVTGSYENPAGISAVLAMLLPIGVHWFINSQNKNKYLSFLLVFLYLVAIILTGARVAMIASFSSIITMLIITKSLRKWLKNHLYFSFSFLGFCLIGPTLEINSVLGCVTK